MSDEPAKDVSPLRLKRPASSAPAPTPAGEGLASESVPPLFVSPGALPPEPGVEPLGGEATNPSVPLAARRRPTLAADEPPPAASAADTVPESEVVAPIKLRMGAKPPPLKPPAVGDNLPDNLFPTMEGAPLVPLAGLAPPPLPTGTRPPGTALIGGLEGGSGAYKLGGPNAPLMSMSVAGSTRPPMPVPGKKSSVKSPAARRDLLIFLLVLVLIGAAGVGGYFYLTRPAASDAVLAGVKDKFEKAAELPGKVIDSAKESMAGARELEQERIDNPGVGKETPEKRGLGIPTPGELEARLKDPNSKSDAMPPATPTPNVVTPVPPKSMVVAADTVALAPKASARFTKYAEALSVSGVFQGSPARALIDGRLIRAGELIEPNLGVTFVGVDSDTKYLILEEKTGAQLRVKY